MKQSTLTRLLLPLATAASLGMLGLDAQAQTAAVDVNVTFTRALVVIAGDPIQFGNIVVNGNAGTVNLDKNDSSVTYSGGVMSIDTTTSQRGFVSFIAPRPGNVGITYPSSINLANSNDPTSIVTFSPAPAVTSRVISFYNENVEIRIGGSLNFPVNTMEGLYSGAVPITVDYI